MKTRELQEILEYFGREQACYTSLLDLSRQQADCIADRDIDQLLAILSQKQQILARVAEIEAKLKPHKENWPELRNTMSRDDRSVVDVALATVEELLAELIAIEQGCEKQLSEQIDSVRDELKEVTHAKGVHSAYAVPKAQDAPRALDMSET